MVSFFSFDFYCNLPTGEKLFIETLEALLYRCSFKTVLWKNAANFQENTHEKLLFQKRCFASVIL